MTVVGRKKEIEEGVKKTKELMAFYEERNNDSKEEELLFSDKESGKIRLLGSWMGWKEDVEERLKRGNRAWWITNKAGYSLVWSRKVPI